MTPVVSLMRRALAATLLLAVAGTAAAQTADAPLKLIVPFTPGTGIDLIARTVGPKLSERLKRPVVVENRAGASGNIGTEAVVRAAPDGSTLLVSVNTLVMNRSLYPQMTFDPVRDLTPIGLTSWGQLILVTHPKTGFKTAADLVAAAKAREVSSEGAMGLFAVALTAQARQQLDGHLRTGHRQHLRGTVVIARSLLQTVIGFRQARPGA